MREPEPADDSKEQQKNGRGKNDLTHHVQTIPARPVRHLVAMLIAQRLSHRAAGTDPAAVRAFAETVDQQWNQHARLQQMR